VVNTYRLVTVVVMSKDLKGKRASLWHAYTALQEQGKDKEKGNAVAKGQLKVCNYYYTAHRGHNEAYVLPIIMNHHTFDC